MIKTILTKKLWWIILLLGLTTYFSLQFSSPSFKDDIIYDYAINNVELNGIKIGEENIKYDEHEANRLKVSLFKKSVIRHFKESNPKVIRDLTNNLIKNIPVEMTMRIQLDTDSVIEVNEFTYSNKLSTIIDMKDSEGVIELNKKEIEENPWIKDLLHKNNADNYVLVTLSLDYIQAGTKKFGKLQEIELVDLSTDYFFRNNNRVDTETRVKWLIASL